MQYWHAKIVDTMGPPNILGKTNALSHSPVEVKESYHNISKSCSVGITTFIKFTLFQEFLFNLTSKGNQ